MELTKALWQGLSPPKQSLQLRLNILRNLQFLACKLPNKTLIFLGNPPLPPIPFSPIFSQTTNRKYYEW